jgi:hypothetical protein
VAGRWQQDLVVPLQIHAVSHPVLLLLYRCCCMPAVQDATELVAALRAFHHKAQTDAEKKHMAQYGLDLVEGKVRYRRKQPPCLPLALWAFLLSPASFKSVICCLPTKASCPFDGCPPPT